MWMTRSLDRSLFLTGPGLRPKPGLGTLTATRTSLRPASHRLAFLTAPGTPPAYRDRGQLCRFTLSLVSLSLLSD
jgi:hypothetical protein